MLSNICNYQNSHHYRKLAVLFPTFSRMSSEQLAVTFLSNILIIIVLSKKHMRSPTNLVLMSMAISDLLTVVFPAPW